MIKGEKGTALVLITFCLTVLLGFVALVTDIGLIYFNKVQVANAVDAAALAGVLELPDETKAVDMAREYGSKNNVENLEAVVSEDKREIRVTAGKTFDLFFARVMGIEQSSVAAVAEAKLESVTAVRGVVPLGITEQTLVYGESYILKYGAGDNPEGDYHSGWLGILALKGTGAKLYEETLKNGFDEELAVGDIVNIQTGNISGKTYSGVQYRLDQCKHTPSCTFEHYTLGCPRIAIVPVIKDYADNQVQVLGFSAFFLESVAGMGNESYITGRFINYTAAGKSSSTGPNYGTFAPVLSK